MQVCTSVSGAPLSPPDDPHARCRCSAPVHIITRLTKWRVSKTSRVHGKAVAEARPTAIHCQMARM